MSKKSDFKDSIKQPDAFVSTSDHVLRFIESHAKTVGTVVFVGAALGLGYTAYTYWHSHMEASAAESLYTMEAKLKKAESDIRDERAKKMQGLAGLTAKSKPAGKSDEVRPVDFAKDYAPIVSSLKAELKGQSSTRAGMVSALNLSYFLVQQKQFQEALEVLKVPNFTPGTGDLLGGFWRMHYGLVLLENNKPDDAIKLYSEVLGASDLKPFHPEAMLKSGIAFEIKGDATKAKETYEKLGREYPNTEASSSATQYLRLLDMKARG